MHLHEQHALRLIKYPVIKSLIWKDQVEMVVKPLLKLRGSSSPASHPNSWIQKSFSSHSNNRGTETLRGVFVKIP